MQNSSPVLLLYSSRFGQCKRIAETLGTELTQLGHTCEIVNIEQNLALTKAVQDYDAVVITASIRYGYYHKKVGLFVQEHLSALQKTLDVFIPINLVARKPERRTIERNSYVKKFLEKTGWHPKLLNIQPGALNYPSYNFFDRFMIKLIMKMTKGETDVTKSFDYTDWEEIKAYATTIHQKIADKTSA
ncbi:MAG: menaquinone-dependent protoporphyrinogen IX dehydrogenase [Saezia sp.]